MDRVPPLKAFKVVSERGFISYPAGYVRMFKPSDHGQPAESVYKLDPRMRAVWNRMSPKLQAEMKKKYKQPN
jgi:hypothetical protein